MDRELRTVGAMIAIYCRGLHGTRGVVCADCASLREYTGQRLAVCPFRADKPTCLNCRVHCYREAMRARIRAVMRYAGPRMVLRHPLLALWHVLDGWKSVPVLKKG